MANSDHAAFNILQSTTSETPPVPISRRVQTLASQSVLDYLQIFGQQGAVTVPSEQQDTQQQVRSPLQETENTEASFDVAKISPWFVRQLLERLDFVITQLAVSVAQDTLQTISMLTKQDEVAIWRWNGAVPCSFERCVHKVFEERVTLQPEAISVSAWDGELSYADLDWNSTLLAHKLIDLGVGDEPDMVVPLCFEKSMWTTVALFAVLKAGGAFLLLDPSLPEKRLQFMVEHVEASLILSSNAEEPLSARLAKQVLPVHQGLLSKLAHQGYEDGDQRKKPSPDRSSPSSVAYVTFTSGSTGAPKCVLVSHANLASALHHQLGPMGLTDTSRVLDFASYSFTTSVSNVCCTLAAGACLCVPSEEDRRDRLQESIQSFQATFIDITPSVARLLVPKEVPTLDTVILGGEMLRKGDIERWWGRVKLIHLYGQSECTSNGTINHEASSAQDVLHIGKGAGLTTWVVNPDDHNVLLPPGCIGELLFEGPLVGQGYLRNPEQSAASFIKDPPWLLRRASGRPGRSGRLYKTGDLVRYREDGNLVFVGRKDTQVKLRGQRVELGEVEFWVRNCLADKTVQQVVAEVIDPHGDESARTLVAFLHINEKDAAKVVDDVDDVTGRLLVIPSDVEDQLAAHLPSYMVPTAFFPMRELPMTVTGKLDRLRLRDIGGFLSVEKLAELRTASGPKRQPSSLTEKSMLKTWAQVLNIPYGKIGLDDSFFHLGGDSITAIRLVAEARKENIYLTVADVFRHPILHQLVQTCLVTAGMRGQEAYIRPFHLLPPRIRIRDFIEGIADQYSLDRSLIRDAYPCTPLQEGLMSLACKRPGNYMNHEVLELRCHVPVRRFRAAWEQAFRSLPILRTRIVQHDDLGLLQLVVDGTISWRTATNLDDYLATDREQFMSLGDPLTRYALIQHDSGNTTFVWTVHHALYDGWSIGLILDAVRQAIPGYRIATGPQPQTFIKHIMDIDNEATSTFWLTSLADFESDPCPRLPSPMYEPVSDKVIEHQFSLKLGRHSKDITTSTLVRAAWALVLSRVSNTEDVVFGVTVSGRQAPVSGIDILVAPTFATVPVRVRTDGARKVSEYLKQLQREAVDMIPFEHAGLLGISQLSPDCERACKFQSLLVIQPQRVPVADEDLGTWRAVIQQHWFNTFALMLEIRLGIDNLTITAAFDSHVMDPWLVQKLLTRLELVIQKLDIAGGEKSLSEIDVMTVSDLEQIWEWNRDVPEAEESLVHDKFQSRVREQPNAPAIRAWDAELSYKELDYWSTDLAERLSKSKHLIEANTLIPLCFGKSAWTPVAMLAVLKMGAAFVLLDPSLPTDRLEAILDQLAAKNILCSPATAKLSFQLSGQIIQFTPGAAQFINVTTPPRPSRVDFAESPTSASTMVVLFTSGTTGKPKGVVISHQNYCANLKHQLHLLGFTQDSLVFDFASYAFDVSVHNVFATLISGGCLCIPSEDDRRSNIAHAMMQMETTIANLTPSVARLIDPATVPCLKTLILSGEAVRVEDVMPWWDRVRVINAYGPAECNISTINGQSSSPQGAIHVGKGAGTVTWVVDPSNHNTLLQPGHTGELLLEGPLVGCGYLNDAEATAKAFIQDPAWLVRGGAGVPGRRGRLYKTGDLVRYNDDGSLNFISRKDTQVKIHGQRVELGDIEHWVQHCVKSAKQVTVELVSATNEAQTPMLVAFLQIEDSNAIADSDPSKCRPYLVSSEIRARLAEHLPGYMIPSVFLQLRQLPLTPTGKTNRKSLHKLCGDFTKWSLSTLQDFCRNSRREVESLVERQIQAVWAQVLGIDPSHIGADDSFIALGGSSISAMKMASEARKIGLRLTVADIFRCPTLAGLASHASLADCASPAIDVESSSTIPRLSRRGFIEQSIAQERLWLLRHQQPRFVQQTAWAVRMRGPLQPVALNKALLALNRRHEILRTTFATDDGVHKQRISDVESGQLHIVDMDTSSSPSSSRHEERGRLEDILQQQRMLPIDLETEPGWRVTLYSLGQEEYVCLIVMHPMVSDGWSADVFRRELTLFYSATIHQDDPLAEVDALPIQYGDYSTWQRLQEHTHKRQLGYWAEQLRSSRPAEIPCDKPRPTTLSGRTDGQEVRISGPLFHQLNGFRKSREVTLFVFLLAAFRATHYLLSDESDATIGTSNANRTRWEVRDLMGPLVNLQGIRIKVEKGDSFEELVRRVEATTIASFSNQDVPFERIASRLQANSDLSRHPLFQIIFAVHTRKDLGQFSLEGMETIPIPMAVTSRFDLEFHLYQEDDGLQGNAIFSTDLYHPKTVENMLSVFRTVLERAIANPAVAISSWTLPVEDE
ncbi:hypothetical protein RJ55_01025 [Drechmeria coniospora]|nr:hypothetical protein RJ55_01025 [Drechmeria coniospora]